MATYELELNGRKVKVEAEPGTPLLWALRDGLGLTGTKYGCGVGACGACTVDVAGAPTKSCLLPVDAVHGVRCRTIEGLSSDASHAVQRAWLEEDVAQCGYCQPAMILAATLLLARTPQPTDAQIDDAMKDVLCRCGSYARIRRAVHRAAGAKS